MVKEKAAPWGGSVLPRRNTQKPEELGIQIVGDDLFTTNPERVRYGISKGAANTVLSVLPRGLPSIYVPAGGGIISLRSGFP